jgi:rRNA maturation RNase YbeY
MILFFSDTSYKLLQKRPIKNWLYEVVKQEGKKIGEINIVFYHDEQLLAFNKQYLHHDTLTDIITFDYSEKSVINGDIFISVDRVIENAKIFHCVFEEELRRVMVHGMLHLCGYKDKKNADKIEMKKKEEVALILFNTKYNY